jgi:hypothetical protein
VGVVEAVLAGVEDGGEGRAGVQPGGDGREAELVYDTHLVRTRLGGSSGPADEPQELSQETCP